MIAVLSRQCTRPVKMEFTVFNTLLISTNLHMYDKNTQNQIACLYY